MNVIVGVIVDAVNDSRKEMISENNEITLEDLSKQMDLLSKKIDELTEKK